MGPKTPIYLFLGVSGRTDPGFYHSFLDDPVSDPFSVWFKPYASRAGAQNVKRRTAETLGNGQSPAVHERNSSKVLSEECFSTFLEHDLVPGQQAEAL